MYTFFKFSAIAVILTAIIVPMSAFAIGIPIGGKVVAEAPCPSGGLIVTVVGFGLGTGVFWYLPPPLTLTYLYGPPIIGEWILGLADGIPNPTCGLHALMTGTAPL